MKIKVNEIEYHRNGIIGNGFHIVKFVDVHDGEKMISIIFDEPGNVAVFDYTMLCIGEIRFGENSWRGDVFEVALRRAIEFHANGKDLPITLTT